jgi:hypothetical protein
MTPKNHQQAELAFEQSKNIDSQKMQQQQHHQQQEAKAR